MLAFVDDLKTFNENHFLNIKLNKDGKEYLNYISNEENDSYFQKEKEKMNDKLISGNCDVTINGILFLKISNETIAELYCVLPFITTIQSKNLNMAGNIITDIRKSSLDIYENFRNLKAKWKAMQYLKYDLYLNEIN